MCAVFTTPRLASGSPIRQFSVYPTLMNQTRGRRFCFTWNNYPLDAEAQLRSFAERKQAIYLVAGRETGESGTPHLQGYVHLKHPITFTAFKRLLPSMHIERARGTGPENETYCTKDGDFFSIGELPKGGLSEEKSKVWSDVLEAAESGNWTFIKREQPRIWIAFRERLLSMRVPRTNVIDGETQNEWWTGPTGSGKSKLAWEKYGTICYQKMLNKWWDGYDAQPVVVIEEWSPKNEVTASSLKIWADRYPFTAQIKGGCLQKIRPIKIIVISNYRLDDCFPDERDRLPIVRRFTQRQFPDDIAKCTQDANDFLATLTPETTPDVEINNEEKTDETVLDDLEIMNLGPFPELTTQGWVDYASSQDFGRMLGLDMI